MASESPGPMKNAIDWGSRPKNVFNGKAAAIVSSGGGNGGALAHYALRQSGVFLNIHFVNTKAVTVNTPKSVSNLFPFYRPYSYTYPVNPLYYYFVMYIPARNIHVSVWVS